MDRCFPRNFHGFNYENSLRNEQLLRMGYKPPPMLSTGTTVVGVVFDNGIMLATDSRATVGTLVISSESRKIYRLHDNLFCAGSGIAGDCAYSARVMEKQLEMLHFNINKRKVRVVSAKQMAKDLLSAHKGRLLVNFIIGGVDPTGIHMFCLNVDGTSTNALFLSIGSGHYGAMCILENRWCPNMDECAARKLVIDAIAAGISNDICSGSSVEVLIVRTDYSVERFTETIHKSNREMKVEVHPPKPGDTSVIYTKFQELELTDERVYQLSPSAPSLPLIPIQSDELRLTFNNTSRPRKRTAVPDTEPHIPDKKRKLE